MLNIYKENLSSAQKLQHNAVIEDQLNRRIEQKDSTFPFVYEAKTNQAAGWTGVIHLANPHEQQRPRSFVSIPTRCSQEEVQRITSSLKPYWETSEMLMAAVHGYNIKAMTLLVGGTSVGKTYAVNKLVELIYGEGVKCLDLYCANHSESSQLYGRYVPTIEDSQKKELVRDFIFSEEGETWLKQQVSDGLLNSTTTLKEKLTLAAIYLNQEQTSSNFEFSFGVATKAAIAEMDKNGIQILRNSQGRGVILHIQEIGLAKPEFVTALLQLRGNDGRLTKDFQLWDDSGRKITIGPDTWIVFSNNPLIYGNRYPIESALIRNLHQRHLGELSEQTIKEASRDYLTYNVGKYHTSDEVSVDLALQPKIGEMLSPALAKIHIQMATDLKSGLLSQERQPNPLTLDTIAHFSSFLITSTQPDIIKRVYEAFDLAYLGRIPVEYQTTIDSLKSGFKALLEGELAVPEGEKDTRAKTIRALYEQLIAGESSIAESTISRATSEEYEIDFADTIRKITEKLEVALVSKDNEIRDDALNIIVDEGSFTTKDFELIWFGIKDLSAPVGVSERAWKKEINAWKLKLGVEE